VPEILEEILQFSHNSFFIMTIMA